MDDTSALDYKEGKDIQGIPWERLNYSRDQYRKMRLKEYKNYQNLTRSRSGLEQECKQVERKDTFYDFQSSTRAVKSTIVHFQVQFYLGQFDSNTCLHIKLTSGEDAKVPFD